MDVPVRNNPDREGDEIATTLERMSISDNAPVFDNPDADSGRIATTEAEVESVHKYTEAPEEYDGRFYPVSIGEVLNGRYRIEHKLASEHFSTTWMAYDTYENEDVTLRIMVGLGEVGNSEFEIQKELIAAFGKQSSRLEIMKDSFLLPDKSHKASCYHRVIIYPFHGPTLYRNFDTAKERMAAPLELLKAVAELHGRGFVHSCLSPGAYYFAARPFPRGTPVETKYKIWGRPLKLPLRDSWRQGERVVPVTPNTRDMERSVVLGWLDTSFKPEHSDGPPGVLQWSYCAPEIMHGQGRTFASDMWSWTCIFANVWHGDSEPFFRDMEDMQQYLGKFPASWKGTYTEGDEDDSWYSDSEASVLHRLKLGDDMLQEDRPDASDEERAEVLYVLSWGLSYNAKDRPTAAQLLGDPVFRKLMARYVPEDRQGWCNEGEEGGGDEDEGAKQCLTVEEEAEDDVEGVGRHKDFVSRFSVESPA